MSPLDNLPPGVSHQSGGLTIHVRRWAEVIEENRQRLHFYRDRLNFEPDDEPTITDLLSELFRGSGQLGDTSSDSTAPEEGAR